MTAAQLPEKREPVHARHEYVREYDVVGIGIEALNSFVAVGGAIGFPASAHEHGPHKFVNRWIIIHDQEPVRRRGWHWRAFDKDT